MGHPVGYITRFSRNPVAAGRRGRGPRWKLLRGYPLRVAHIIKVQTPLPCSSSTSLISALTIKFPSLACQLEAMTQRTGVQWVYGLSNRLSASLRLFSALEAGGGVLSATLYGLLRR